MQPKPDANPLLIIPAGTQVVANVTVRLPQDGLTRPAGNVGDKEKQALTEASIDMYRSEFERLTLRLEETAAASTLPEAPSAAPALNDLLIRVRLEGLRA